MFARLRASPALAATLAGALLCLTALGLPFWSDDLIQLLILEDHLGLREPEAALLTSRPDLLGLYNAFGFFGHDPAVTAAARTNGELAWWTDEHVRLSFWRPLSSALFQLDYRLFGLNPTGFHLHSMLWYLATCAVVGRLLNRTLGSLGVLAAVLWAWDDARWLPMAWVANRNALVSALPALVGLWGHLRWREEGWAPGALAGPVGLALGLAGGETALSVLPFFLCYELLAAPGTGRVRALMPIGGITLAWAALYRLGGYGGGGSALYLDPIRDFGAFAAAAPGRALVLIGSALGGIPAEFSLAVPGAKPLWLGLGALTVVLAGLLLRWAPLEPAERRALRWLVPASVLALVPVLATFPLDRLLFLPGLGGAALVALAIRGAWQLRGAARAVVALPLVMHGLLPLALSLVYRVTFEREPAVMAALYDEAFEGDAVPERAVVLCASDMTVGLYFPAWTALNDKPHPKSLELISPAPVDHRVTRTGERTYEVELLAGGLNRAFLVGLTRKEALVRGSTVRGPTGEITVLETGPEGPTRLSLRLDEGQTPLLLAWDAGHLRPVSLAPGASILIPWTPGPKQM